eukprot:NODE_9946_length_1388_cov_11.087232.p1 GENE.NODE_9946_length_1388_cov_11.087232~~NODE_9946_length_1388_cov_11.087232.p1  ORF type:complete len:300 (+),score=106.70 NODE_9946_length_1388_cov_11.087232:67-900(+)
MGMDRGERSTPPKARCDVAMCAQSYACVPVTVISVVCLALYKAEADAQSVVAGDAQRTASQKMAVEFLKAIGCRGLLEEAEMDDDTSEHTIFLLHEKFIGVAMFAVIMVLVVLAMRAIPPASTVPPVSPHFRYTRSGARLGFAAACSVLIFAAVGFQPVILCGIAVLLSSISSIVVVAYERPLPVTEDAPEESALPPVLHGGAERNFRLPLEAHTFSLVTISCIYCLGCITLEKFAASPGVQESKVILQIIGLELAITAAVWFAITLAFRAWWNRKK